MLIVSEKATKLEKNLQYLFDVIACVNRDFFRILYSFQETSTYNSPKVIYAKYYNKISNKTCVSTKVSHPTIEPGVALDLTIQCTRLLSEKEIK